jgi:uncharacterized membrane protein
MRGQVVLGIVLILAGFILLYLLRDLVVKIIVFLIEFLGVAVAIALIVVGIGLIFWMDRWRFRRVDL